MEKKMRHFNFRNVDEDAWKYLKFEAIQRNIPFYVLINEILVSHVKELKKKAKKE